MSHVLTGTRLLSLLTRLVVLGSMIGLSVSCTVFDEWLADDLNECARLCEHIECGQVGDCQCGTCDDGLTCHSGRCSTCDEVCATGQCGLIAGCDCGGCGDHAVCHENTCLSCFQACSDKECGDSLGCDCGGCPEGTECDLYGQCRCIPVCWSDADGPFECGDDNCGGSCGLCVYGECVNHACYCEPSCPPGACGDGCGGSCDPCDEATPVCFEDACYPICPGDSVKMPLSFQRINALEIGKGGHEGEALDLDGKPETCTPIGDCEQGFDNIISSVTASIFGVNLVSGDEELADLVANHGLTFGFQLPNDYQESDEFVIRLYPATPVLPRSECDYQTEICEYVGSLSSLHPATCEPMLLDNARADGNVIWAGGPGYQVLLPNPFVPHEYMELIQAHNGQLLAELTFCEVGPWCLKQGILAGALRKEDMFAALDDLPEDADLPVSQDMLKNLVDMFVVPDIDTDGDGVPDAASLAYKFTTIPGTIVGFEED